MLRSKLYKEALRRIIIGDYRFSDLLKKSQNAERIAIFELAFRYLNDEEMREQYEWKESEMQSKHWQ